MPSSNLVQKVWPGFHSARWTKSRRWGLHIYFSTADQGLFSGANFVGAILLAKAVSPDDYGAYSIAFAVYLVFTSFYTSLLLEPVSVLGWTLSSALGTGPYLYRLGLCHLALTIPLSLAAAFGSLFAGKLRSVLLMMALSLPFSLLVWGIRRVAYVYTKPVAACVCSAAYCAALLGSTLLLRGKHLLTAPLFFVCMGFSGLVASAPGLLVALRQKADCQQVPGGPDIGQSVWRQHWDFGKWLVISSLMITVSNQAQFILSAAFLDLQSAGVLRAMMNFTLPPVQVITAVSMLTLPPLARKYESGDYPAFLRLGHIVTLGLTGGTLIFELILFTFRRGLSVLAYGDKFAGYSGLIPLFGLLAVMQALGSYALVMRAMRRPQATLYIAGASLLCVLVLTAPMTKLWGVFGTATSTVLSYAAAAGVSFYLASRYGKGLIGPIVPLKRESDRLR